MGAKGTFDIPAGREQSTDGARHAYEAAYSRKWPHDDAYLRELAAEVPSAQTCHYWRTTRCEFLLLRMRENDC